MQREVLLLCFTGPILLFGLLCVAGCLPASLPLPAAAPPGPTAQGTTAPAAGAEDVGGRDTRFGDLATGYEQLRWRERSVRGQPSDSLNLEIDALVVDETLSKLGRDFYEIFYSRWQAAEGASGYTIRVEEQPLPSLGTLVRVRVNDEVAFQERLQPRYEAIEAAALGAVFLVRQQVQQQPTLRVY